MSKNAGSQINTKGGNMDLEHLEKELKKMDGLVLELEKLGLAGHRQEIDKLHRRLDKLKTGEQHER